MSRELTDREVVDAFVAYRGSTDHPGIVVDRRPDEDNRNSSDIDALAGPLAIEHTSVDTVSDQRRDGAQFMQVVEPLEQQLGPGLGFRLRVTFPYEGVTVGQDWQAMREALEEWIRSEAPSLADGRHLIKLPYVPFAFEVDKTTAGTPGLFFSRFSPVDSTLSERIREQVERKAAKLGSYKKRGKTAVLLVESDDIALMNKAKLLEAVRLAFPSGLPVEIDELWYIDTSVPAAPPQFHALTAAVNTRTRESAV